MTDTSLDAGALAPGGAAKHTPRTALSAELRALLSLAWPLMLAQGGMMLMGVVDTIVVGRVSARDMAAVALGNSLAATFGVFALGVAMGIEPLVGQAHGSGDPRRAYTWLWQGLYAGILASIPTIALLALTPLAFAPSGVEPAVAEVAAAYVWARIPSVSLWAVLAAQRSYLSNTGSKWPYTFAVIGANVINLVLDLLLAYGWGGFPRLGAVGTAWATSGSVALMVLVLSRAIAARRLGPRPVADRAAMGRIFGLGWPIGSQAALETGVFMAVAWAVGAAGEIPLAGHSIALTVCSMTFMMAVGIGNATAARVAFHLGAGDPERAAQLGFAGIGLGAAFMGLSGLGLFVFARGIARAFTDDDAVVEVGATLVRVAGVFALSDGLQGVSTGALRGVGDTRWAFWTNLGAHWVVGFPVGAYLGYLSGWGALGYWWGLTVGLSLVAIVLVARFAQLARRGLVRLEALGVDGPRASPHGGAADALDGA